MEIAYIYLVCGCVAIMLVGLIRPQAFKNKKTGEVPTQGVIIAGSIGLLAIGLVLLSFISEDEPKAMPAGTLAERVKWLDEKVSDVSEINDGLMITYQMGDLYSEDLWVYSFFNNVLEIMPRLKEAANGSDLKQVAFMVRVNTISNLGEKSTGLAMKVFYDYPKFAKAQWQNMTPYSMMEAVEDIQFKRHGKELGLAYCNADENSNVKLSPYFCQRVLNHAIGL